MGDLTDKTGKRPSVGWAGIAEAGKATRFKPGASSNPLGRPKNAPLSRAIREQLSMPSPDDRRCPHPKSQEGRREGRR